VAAGAGHSAAVTASGELFAWGLASNGQCGQGVAAGASTFPRPMLVTTTPLHCNALFTTTPLHCYALFTTTPLRCNALFTTTPLHCNPHCSPQPHCAVTHCSPQPHCAVTHCSPQPHAGRYRRAAYRGGGMRGGPYCGDYNPNCTVARTVNHNPIRR
jgi:hypothetical protein